MDLGYLKIKIDIKSEYEEFKRKYEYKKKEIKKEEIKKTFEGFKEFFKTDGNFKFKENEHAITAEYKDYGISLEMDKYKNIDSPDFMMDGTIKTYEKEVFTIFIVGSCNKHIEYPVFKDEQERMVYETQFFKDFLNEEIFYTFHYTIQGKDVLYQSMQELMQGL